MNRPNSLAYCKTSLLISLLAGKLRPDWLARNWAHSQTYYLECCLITFLDRLVAVLPTRVPTHGFFLRKAWELNSSEYNAKLVIPSALPSSLPEPLIFCNIFKILGNFCLVSSPNLSPTPILVRTKGGVGVWPEISELWMRVFGFPFRSLAGSR